MIRGKDVDVQVSFQSMRSLGMQLNARGSGARGNDSQEQDVTSMSVAELKALLQSRGCDSSACVEQAELLAEVKRTMSSKETLMEFETSDLRNCFGNSMVLGCLERARILGMTFRWRYRVVEKIL